MTTKKSSKDDLAARYPDDEWRRRFVELSDLVGFLDDCVISDQYKPSDALNAAAHLSELGNKMVRELTRQSVPTKEARLMCLVQTAHRDPLVDVVGMDLDALRDAIGAELLSGALRFPFVYGRALYDRAADLYPDMRHSLTGDETLALLDGTPVGVFQHGRFLSGPYGLLQSVQTRQLRATRSVPLFSCSDLSCDAVHACVLGTGWDAPVNDHRSKLTKLLQQQSKEPSDWGDFLHDITKDQRTRYDDFNRGTLPYLLGDGLSEIELRGLAEWLVNHGDGGLRDVLQRHRTKPGPAKAMVDGLDRAALMQLALINTDQALEQALEHLVASGDIAVPLGEVRRPVVHAGVRVGTFGVQVQLGTYGLRMQPADLTVASLRLRRVVDALFRIDDPTTAPELEWQLRGVDAPTIAAKLEQYLRTETPRDVLQRLVLASRSNFITACTGLGVDEHREDRSDAQLVDTLLWKLGFSIGDDRDPTADLRRHQERMEQVVRTAGVSPLVDQDDLRSRGVNYFVKLEEALDDALAFTTWALVWDHYAAEAPFTYRPETDRRTAFDWLHARYRARHGEPQPGEPTLAYGDKNTLHVLCRGFDVLAVELEALDENKDSYRRADDQRPAFVDHTDLQQFPFVHTHAFLDLLPDSKTRLLSTLREVSRGLVNARVSDIRNEQVHYRRSTADLEKLQQALTAAKDAVDLLDRAGLTRVPYARKSAQRDAWGRMTYVLSAVNGREIAFVLPTSFDWLRLPGFSGRQYVVPDAQFGEPNGILRFRLGFNSEYAEMWSGFPRRRKLSPSLSPLQPREERRGATSGATTTSD